MPPEGASLKRSHSRRFRLIASIFVLVLFVSVTLSVRSHASFTDTIVTITALIGAFALYTESRRGKNIAMGEFIVNLNAEFDSHQDRAMVHRKIISGEPLLPGDKPAIVAYLTFFEIIYRLVLSDVMRMDMIDDLFRSRFFKAVHHIDIQNLELLPDADGYLNIYELEELWLAYLSQSGGELKRGDRRLPASARRRAADQVRFSIESAARDEAKLIHDLIVEAAGSASPGQFYVNDLETLEHQMDSGFTLKGYAGQSLAGILHVHYPEPSQSHAERVGDQFGTVDVAHMDIAAVLPKFRGYGLMELLLIHAEEQLEMNGQRFALYATVAPDNGPSIRSFEFCGYEKVDDTSIHGTHQRYVFRKLLSRAAQTDASAPLQN